MPLLKGPASLCLELVQLEGVQLGEGVEGAALLGVPAACGRVPLGGSAAHVRSLVDAYDT
jgi:hypothetical protein